MKNNKNSKRFDVEMARLQAEGNQEVLGTIEDLAHDGVLALGGDPEEWENPLGEDKLTSLVTTVAQLEQRLAVDTLLDLERDAREMVS